ncbi:MAG: hypothetical protein EXS05_09900 [Planctomycetaceae bacterium]|nr:hypothetical protein [Planctomycetaceae bacterium]
MTRLFASLIAGGTFRSISYFIKSFYCLPFAPTMPNRLCLDRASRAIFLVLISVQRVPMREGLEVRHIKLDRQTAQVKQFVLSLPVDPDGSILELRGEPVFRVLPVIEREQAVDKAKLKAAILRRRDESRRLNDEWGAADREVWEQPV